MGGYVYYIYNLNSFSFDLLVDTLLGAHRLIFTSFYKMLNIQKKKEMNQ